MSASAPQHLPNSTELLLAEALFLLLHDDRSGRPNGVAGRDNAYAGALLLDLIDGGFLRADGDHLLPAGDAPTHPLLRAARTAIAADRKPRKAAHWVQWLPRALAPLEASLGRSLAGRDIVDEQRGKALGVFPITRWVQRDPGPKLALRERLGAVLTGATEPNPREALLTTLLGPMHLVSGLVAGDEVKAAKARAKAIVESTKTGQETSAAVASAVAAIDAALVAAVVVTAVVGSS